MAAQFAFDYDFETDFYGSNAAPVLEPEKSHEPRHNLRKLKKRRPRKIELERASHIKVAKIFVVMSLAIALAGAFCNSLVARTESRAALQSAKKELAMYSDENVVLQNKLSKLVSAENIDKIATQKLGLVKIASVNETYLETEKENEVLFSQSK